MNRKVKYTKSVIKSSFFDLLSEKDFNNITVKELCEKADINRGTFYRHYLDIYDLLTQLENEISELSMHMFDFTDVGTNIEKIYYDVLTNIKNNLDLYQLIFLNPSSIKSFDQVLDSTYKVHMKKSMNINEMSEDMLSYTFDYMLFGSKQVISRWISSGCRETPKELANLLSSLSFK